MSIELRTLDYGNVDEVRRYLALFYAIPAELDPYYTPRSSEQLDALVTSACRDENASNTFAGIALDGSDIVGLHILRRFEEGALVGVHIAGLWVAESHRHRGIARGLKERGETWARSVGADFMNTNVLSTNARMLAINERLGFAPYKVNLRKRLPR